MCFQFLISILKNIISKREKVMLCTKLTGCLKFLQCINIYVKNNAVQKWRFARMSPCKSVPSCKSNCSCKNEVVQNCSFVLKRHSCKSDTVQNCPLVQKLSCRKWRRAKVFPRAKVSSFKFVPSCKSDTHPEKLTTMDDWSHW